MKVQGTIDKKDYIWIYDSIPMFAKRKVTELMGFNQPSKFTQCKQISKERFNILNDFAIKHGYKSNNFVGKPANFDKEQVHDYFKKLTTFINSLEYNLLSNNQKEKVINEHKTIHNLLLTE